MSRLLIKQKVFSWTDSYEVYDSNDYPKYDVKADFFSIGHRIRVYEKGTGREVGLIQEKVLRLFKEYDIYVNGSYQGIVKQQFSLLRPKYNIDYKGWKLSGDIFEWNYDIYEYSRLVVHISKELFHWGDTYVLEIEDARDELLALMVAIAMDAAKCSEEGNRNSFL